jgi:hypothetical protein
MQTPPVLAQAAPSQSSRGSRQRWRKPRRGGRQEGTASTNVQTETLPAVVASSSQTISSVTPSPAPETTTTNATSEAARSSRRGGRVRGGSGRGRGVRRGAAQAPLMTSGGRVFGGQLTSADQGLSRAEGDLQGDAPEFRPGQAHMPRRYFSQSL